jgi:hypothetical protein
MISVNVSSNIKDVSARFGRLTEAVTDRAVVRALNRSLDRANTVTNQQIRKVYNVKPPAVTSALRKQRAFRKAINTEAVLKIEGVRIALHEFQARERTVRVGRRRYYGVSVKVLKGGQRKVVKGGFMVTVGGSLAGSRGIFRRKGAARYPIEFVRSVSIPRTFRNDAVLRVVKAEARETFVKNYIQQVRFLTGRSSRADG